jgi:glutaredoxin
MRRCPVRRTVTDNENAGQSLIPGSDESYISSLVHRSAREAARFGEDGHGLVTVRPPPTPARDRPGRGTMAGMSGLVTLIGKPGCHLCEDAEKVVSKVCGELGVRWEQKDITQDEELHRAYWEQIPVVLIDGRQHTFWRVDESRLRAALA